MAVPFSNTKLRPPRGFRNILEGLSREVLRCQPGDIYSFGSLYFDRLLRIRQGQTINFSRFGSAVLIEQFVIYYRPNPSPLDYFAVLDCKLQHNYNDSRLTRPSTSKLSSACAYIVYPAVNRASRHYSYTVKNW